MSRQEDNDLERRLRAAFEPRAETVNRVVAAALSAPHGKPMLSRVAAAAALVAGLLVLLILIRPRSEVQAESLRLEYVGDVALVELADGSCWLVTPDATSQGPQTPLNFIAVEGEKP